MAVRITANGGDPNHHFPVTVRASPNPHFDLTVRMNPDSHLSVFARFDLSNRSNL
ncbi:MAG: hypothetical protein IIB40_07415 [Candidatus Marinimicrobia bacterium]|nr:hypothetical protein [Candidatus Neomarinimicrobiota bacterium]